MGATLPLQAAEWRGWPSRPGLPGDRPGLKMERPQCVRKPLSPQVVQDMGHPVGITGWTQESRFWFIH